MKHKLSLRLTATYCLIFLLAVAAIDTALIMVYRDNQLRKNERFYNGIAGMLSAMVGNNIKITGYINEGGITADDRSGRLLLLNSDGTVLLDSGGELAGTRVSNPEYRSAITLGKSAAGYYTHQGRKMAVFSYPVKVSGKIDAVILISVYIQDIYDDIFHFSLQIVAISLLVTLLVAAASIWTGRRISRPITVLTAAAEEISGGKTGISVETGRKDEIGRLAGAFNKMSLELQKLENGRRRFISDVSHELKTPLASMKALVEAMIPDDVRDINHAGSAADMECLRDINHEIDRLTGLVRSLLTSARLEEVEMKREQLKLSEEVRQAVKALMPLAAQKSITVKVECDDSAVIYADRNMLREILVNLLDNSIKYGRENGHVLVHCGRVYFSVADDGCGIPEGELPNIFSNFYRVDRSRTGDGGSGIGLFIVKRIVQLHGFEIGVTSEPGKGSEFRVIFGKN